MYKFNDLKVSCDWISFTADVENVTALMDLFGFMPDMFKNMNHGAQGYKAMLRHESHEITLLYDGSEGMGVHCDIKGSAVSYFIECFKNTLLVPNPYDDGECYEVPDFSDLDNIVRLVYQKVLSVGWFTRLDIAIDDIGCNYFTCQSVFNVLKNCNYVSKFRKWEADVSYDKNVEYLGYTIYCGARKDSEIFLRIYDKRLEQLKKNNTADLPDWVRWEFELKSGRADNFAKYIIAGNDFGCSAMALLNNYMRFVVPDDVNKSRCSSLPDWERFVGDVGKLRLAAPKKEKSVDKARDWIKRQCLPTIAGLCVADGGTLDFLTKDLLKHYDRLSLSDKLMYQEYLFQTSGLNK